jgi:hypothetical protein
MIVHVYRVTEMFVVNVAETDHQQALMLALKAARDGEVEPEARPDTKFLGLIPGKQDPAPNTPAVNPADVVRLLSFLTLDKRIEAVRAAGLFHEADDPFKDATAWTAQVLSRAVATRRLHALHGQALARQ